jgi:hypothetical protein
MARATDDLDVIAGNDLVRERISILGCPSTIDMREVTVHCSALAIPDRSGG